RRDGGGILAFVHGTLLGALGVLGLETVLDQIHAHALRGIRLPIAIATLPALVVAADWLVGLVIRRRGIRLVIEAAAVLVACLMLGRPPSTAPLASRGGTGGAPPPRPPAHPPRRPRPPPPRRPPPS